MCSSFDKIKATSVPRGHIIDQCSGAGDITAKKMMGDYCVYCDGVFFGLVCDNNLFVKPTYPGSSKLKKVEM